jgi:ankyrin repeat protein
LDNLRYHLLPSIRHTLDELLESLDETYDRILLKIDKEKQANAYQILQCLVVSIRPLRIEELIEIFGARTVEETIPADWRPENAEEFILSACSTLVTVVNVNDNKVIQFSHFSVKEYLTSHRIANSEHVSHFHIHPESAHVFLARACIGTLLQLDDQIDKTTIKNFPLASYAARHWVDHAQFEDVSSYIQDAMEFLFYKDKPHFAAWIWLYDIDKSSPQSTSTTHPEPPDAVPLYYATLCGFCDLAERLIDAHPEDVSAKGGRCRTPLHGALDRGHEDVAILLLERGADVKSRGIYRHTPLHLSAHHGSADAAQLLIECGADPNAENVGRETPLIVASNNGRLWTAELLLEHGADTDKADSSGWTSLHVASLNGHTDVVELLLDHSANVNAENDIRDTPLHIASSRGEIMVTEVLLEYGADVGARDTQGGTPLHDAAESGSPEVVQLLLDYGADVNAQNENGQTPLHLAAYRGHVQVGKLLLKCGGHWYSEDNEDNTPLEVALESNHGNFTQLLSKRGW